ncbi:hypothetical protein [Rhodobacter capsulatus]|uniref:Uncharacterized protein n=1 Tax=Rhodobacter capsulatus (strain ATCC BAA-309 / NBRC 16581 / SB1003) TaxID=272942 RepID=D5AS81_RHOCB|nr:hypothetical protein [Rhodobacter capsulatus]ADE87103.1 conserved hypothetical protein [Rhodobacter capsulatus SB 1003]ETD03336.1 hypothetical protein U714_00005 [Rhodobacter capsulatus DE442]ETD78197.1 hypothetical protein U716_16920 [Rhodobacter capsulatus B6]ETD80131.1 hypothetical protein U717_00005 [Rhodobacter capsulatus R121]ETD82874.1 hypothetical protein U703_11720 [Rhodobacter capsulatus YW1]
MMRRGLRSLMVAALCMVPAAGMAQDLVTVGTVGVWDVLVDPTIGNGCLINAEFEDGSDVRIGFDPEKGNGYLMAMNADWGDIEDDKTYPVSFDVDGQVYQGEGKGLHLDGLPGLDIAFDSADFLMDIAQKQTLTLSNAEGEVMSIDLTDSYAALEAAVACQQNQ